MESVIRVQILYKADCNFFRANFFGEVSNPSVLPPAMGKLPLP